MRTVRWLPRMRRERAKMMTRVGRVHRSPSLSGIILIRIEHVSRRLIRFPLRPVAVLKLLLLEEGRCRLEPIFGVERVIEWRDQPLDEVHPIRMFREGNGFRSPTFLNYSGVCTERHERGALGLFFRCVCSIEGVHDLSGQYPYRWGRSSSRSSLSVVAIGHRHSGRPRSACRRAWADVIISRVAQRSGTAPPR